MITKAHGTGYWMKNIGDPQLEYDAGNCWPAWDPKTEQADCWFPSNQPAVSAGDGLVVSAAHGPGRIVAIAEALTGMERRWDTLPGDRYPWRVRLQLRHYVLNPWQGWFVRDVQPLLPDYPAFRWPLPGSHSPIPAGLYAALAAEFARRVGRTGGGG